MTLDFTSPHLYTDLHSTAKRTMATLRLPSGAPPSPSTAIVPTSSNAFIHHVGSFANNYVNIVIGKLTDLAYGTGHIAYETGSLALSAGQMTLGTGSQLAIGAGQMALGAGGQLAIEAGQAAITNAQRIRRRWRLALEG